MESIKPAGELSQRQSQEASSHDELVHELRALNDLELVLTAGGNGIPSWP